MGVGSGRRVCNAQPLSCMRLALNQQGYCCSVNYSQSIIWKHSCPCVDKCSPEFVCLQEVEKQYKEGTLKHTLAAVLKAVQPEALNVQGALSCFVSAAAAAAAWLAVTALRWSLSSAPLEQSLACMYCSPSRACCELCYLLSSATCAAHLFDLPCVFHLQALLTRPRVCVLIRYCHALNVWPAWLAFLSINRHCGQGQGAGHPGGFRGQGEGAHRQRELVCQSAAVKRHVGSMLAYESCFGCCG